MGTVPITPMKPNWTVRGFFLFFRWLVAGESVSRMTLILLDKIEPWSNPLLQSLPLPLSLCRWGREVLIQMDYVGKLGDSKEESNKTCCTLLCVCSRYEVETLTHLIVCQVSLGKDWNNEGKPWSILEQVQKTVSCLWEAFFVFKLHLFVEQRQRLSFYIQDNMN